MSGLLQRLAGQARGANRPRIRSAAAVHAQVPIAVPSRAPRGPCDAARALEGAATSTTRALTPPALRDHDAPAVAAASAVERHIPEVAIRERLDERQTPQTDDNPSLSAIVPVAELRAPAALVPEVAAPVSPVAGVIRPALLQEPKEGSSRETTEVHVHIGRIEVTALPAPAAPQPKARAARPSVPLSDYLARRRPS